MTLRFHIPGPPRGKGRARSTRSGHHYTPEATVAYEGLVKLAAHRAMAGRELYQGAVWMQVSIVMPIPKSAPKARRERMLSGALRPTTKPDIDNCMKAVADGLNGVAFHDDSQISDLTVTRRYGETPGVWVSLGEAGGVAEGYEAVA
jgi:Holliday junction resolvase RusA-like endonuclease